MILTADEIAEIRAHHVNGAKQVKLAQTYGVSRQVIGRVIHHEGYTSNHIARWTKQAREAHQRLKRTQRDRGLNARLTREQVVDIKARLARGEQGEKIAEEYGVTESAISLIRHGKRWKASDRY